ncbi:MAG: nadD [Acidobacteria bacterium]|nr:nadD [Acidobacteriota bacterium]
MTRPARTGVMGGTFDPVHLGHLAAAAAAADALALDGVLFVPSNHPPHRAAAPRVSGYQRFALVALAIAADPRFAASDLELSRPGPSFTADTLRRLHGLGYAPSQLFVILGSDAFAEIATWHEYPAVLDLAGFAVVARPGSDIALLRAQVPETAPRLLPPAGAGTRAAVDPKPGQIALIAAQTPDVSSTMIRARLERGLGLDGLVPPAVEAHIRRHGLYLPDPEPPGRQLA